MFSFESPLCDFLADLTSSNNIIMGSVYIRYRSCRRVADKWVVAMNKWQDFTDMVVDKGKHAFPNQFIIERKNNEVTSPPPRDTRHAF